MSVKIAASPAARLGWMLAALGAVALLAPLRPELGTAAALAAAALIALAAADGWTALRAPAARVWVADADGRPATHLALIAGREADLRLQIATQGPARGRLALLASNPDLAAAVRLPEQPVPFEPGSAGPGTHFRIEPRRRGRFHGLRCGLERASRLGLWRIRSWIGIDCALVVYPDLAAARRQLLRSPIYRALTAAATVPLAGQGREFERLREYQPGDSYASISWKATARRAFPVTRVFQWERQQELYILLDHSQSAAPALETMITAALLAASAAAETGDRYGLITFADGLTGWLPASSGATHFRQCREHLARLRTLPGSPDFDRLFSAVRLRLRRRAYLLVLANLADRALAQPFAAAAALAAPTHLILAQSVRPEYAKPMFGSDAPPSVDAIYRALAGDRELRRLEELGRELARRGVAFRTAPAARFALAASESYLRAKQEQRL